MAGFRLPRLENNNDNSAIVLKSAIANDDVVVVEAEEEGGEGRILSDIPRDHSGLQKAGFKLPLPDREVLEAAVVENEPSDRTSKALDIPRDGSAPGKYI